MDKAFLDGLLVQAQANPRLRQHYDLRTSEADTSQRLLNALMPGTVAPIHRHEDTSETVVCLCGRLDVTIPSTPYFIKPSLFRTLQFKTTKSSKNV